MRRLLCTAVAVAFAIGSSAHAEITVEVFPAFAPVGPGNVSPSWNDWASNAISFLQNGTGDVASRTDPTDFELIPLLPATTPNSEFLVTTFNSWRSEAGAAAPFAGEFGNRWHATTRIEGDGVMQFALKDIVLTADSDDTSDTFDQPPISLAGLSFSDTRVGINFGGDGPGGANADVVYNSANPGDDMTLVDAMYYVGFGDGFFMDGNDEGETPTDINEFIAVAEAMEIRVGYQVLDDAGMVMAESSAAFGTSAVPVIPEPAAITIALLGIFGLISSSRRRKLGN